MADEREIDGRRSALARMWPILAILVAAALILLPGLGATGLWTRGELPVLDRTLAALGEPRAELVRSPWLPDHLRTWLYAASGRSDAGLRLPGALAGIGLVALTLGFARRLGWSRRWVALAGCFTLALPLLLVSSRTVLGNPTGELWIGVAVLALVEAGASGPGARRPIVRALLGLIGGLSLVAAVASVGIVLGACLPLSLVALADVATVREAGESSDPPPKLSRWAVACAWAGAAIAGFAGLWLAYNQGEGYIPLLGAARNLDYVEEPTKRLFTDTLERFGYQLFPFTGLVFVALLGPGRARWAGLWLGIALVLTSLWALTYGPTPTPATIPAALLATAACERMLDGQQPIVARRLVLFAAILGALILAKDAGRWPERVASPLLAISPVEFPAAGIVPGLTIHELLPSLGKRFAAVLLLAHVLTPPSVDQLRLRARKVKPWWLRRWIALAPVFDRLLTSVGERSSGLLRARVGVSLGLVFVVLAAQAWSYGHVALRQVGEQMSIAGPLQRFATAVERGEIPDARLSLHRIRDPGLDYYGPGAEHELYLSNRGDLDEWLAADAPRTALVRRSDLAPSFTAARAHDRPLFVLDDRHHEYLLVANFLPDGYEDRNPALDVLLEQPATLANEVLVAWEPYVELIAWQIEGDVHRGSEVTLHLVFHVLRPLPTGTKLYARLQKDKVSRVAAEPHELTGGKLPPNYWRAGDYIHHQHSFEVPWLEVLPGEHELIVGLRRSEKTNLQITTPATKTKQPVHGAMLRGGKNEFATIGTVELTW